MPDYKAILMFHTPNDQLEYVCQAQFGSNPNEPVWSIRKLFYDVSGNMTEVRYANATPNYDKLIDYREFYSYTGNIETVIAATEDIDVLIPIDLTGSGPGYVKSGDDGYIGGNEAVFLANPQIVALKDGVTLEKGVEAIYISATSLMINKPLLVGQSLVVRG